MSDANLLDHPHTFHYNDYLVIGGIRTCLGVSNHPIVNFFEFLSNEFAACSKPPSRDNDRKASYPKRNNLTRMKVEPRSFDQGRRKNDAITHSATLPTRFTVTILFSPTICDNGAFYIKCDMYCKNV